MKRVAAVTMLVLAFMATPALGQSIYVGAGPTFPTSDYGGYADNGFMLAGGVTFEIAGNLDVYGEGFWGQNKHNVQEQGDPKTNPLGFMAGLLYGFGGEDLPVDPYVFGGLGILQHRYSAAGESSSDSAFGFQGGAGVGFDIGGLGAFAEGRYMYASFDAESPGGDSEATAFYSILVGLSFDLGGSD